MARFTKIATSGLILALSLMTAGSAGAQVALPSVGGVNANAADLQALENRIQRQQYQQQQQQFREEDRLSIPLRQQRQEVPIIRPGCQTQIYGNRIASNCR